MVELQGIHLETTGLGDELDGARAFGGVGVGAQHLVATVDVDLHGAAIHEHAQVQLAGGQFGVGQWGGAVAAIAVGHGLTIHHHAADLAVISHVGVGTVLSGVNLQTRTLGSGGSQVDGHFDFHGLGVVGDDLLAIHVECDRTMVEGILAQAFHFGDRRGDHVAVIAKGDLARQGELATPAVILHGNRLHERAHPAIDDLTAVHIEGLRGVVVVAAIPQAELGFRLEFAARLPRADHVAGVADVAVHEAAGLGPHGGEANDPLLVAVLVFDGEEVGAFEHEHIRIRVLEEHALVFPADHVLGGEQPHLAALVRRGDTEGHVPDVAGLPDLRVAVVVVDLVGRAVDDHALLGGGGELVIVRQRGHLHLPVAAGVVVAVGPTVAGVVEAKVSVVVDDGRTGEHAVLLLL